MQTHVCLFVLFVVRLFAHFANKDLPDCLLPVVVIGRGFDFARFDWHVHAVVEPQGLEGGE